MAWDFTNAFFEVLYFLKDFCSEGEKLGGVLDLTILLSEKIAEKGFFAADQFIDVYCFILVFG